MTNKGGKRTHITARLPEGQWESIFVSLMGLPLVSGLTSNQAGLFFTVASAFTADTQQELRPDYTEMSFTVLTTLLNTTSSIPNHLKTPVQSGTSPSAVQVQSILFVSLASSVSAASLAMLRKQSLNLCVERSLIDRRELRMRGMIT